MTVLGLSPWALVGWAGWLLLLFGIGWFAGELFLRWCARRRTGRRG